MNAQDNTTNYRRWVVIAIIGNLVLAVALVGFWWHSHSAAARRAMQANTTASTQMDTSSQGAASSSSAVAAPATANQSEIQLAPIQLTPQRMQSIGVQLGTAQMKSVSNDIRLTGNVDVNERELATVQLRFPGWIHKVFVDATYDYVRKGQPLFTVYSPDLVTTEREYLLARKNQQDLGQSSVEGVAAGADTLVSAARERLQQWEVPQSEIAKLESTGQPIT